MTGSEYRSDTARNSTNPPARIRMARGRNRCEPGFGARGGTRTECRGCRAVQGRRDFRWVMSFDWKTLETDVDEQLARAGVAGHPALALDHARIERHARAIAKGELSKAANAVGGRVEAAGPGDVEALERIPSRERAELERLGRDAITRGRVAVAVLNGGMATRFGGDVKGIVEAVAGGPFPAGKLGRARGPGPLPLLVLNSLAPPAPFPRFPAH